MELYGTTEAGNATICDFDHPQLGTAGPPAPYTELQIIDPETGAKQPQGQEGEIKVRHRLGPDYILREYYKDPEKTRQTLVDGWWHSGDMGLIDDQGCLRFMARIKDYLRVGGENVSTRVVENTLRLRAALKARRIPLEMHLFANGGHGFGLRKAIGKPVEVWPDLWRNWARTVGLG